MWRNLLAQQALRRCEALGFASPPRRECAFGKPCSDIAFCVSPCCFIAWGHGGVGPEAEIRKRKRVSLLRCNLRNTCGRPRRAGFSCDGTPRSRTGSERYDRYGRVDPTSRHVLPTSTDFARSVPMDFIRVEVELLLHFVRLRCRIWSPMTLGDREMDQVLTVVLPVHNRERQLRSSVLDILDLVPVLSQPLEIVIVDDASTDDTYETACELARMYPQVAVLRQPLRQGIGATLELVRNRLSVDRVLVHDGISPIDAGQLQSMLQTAAVGGDNSTVSESSGSRRFAAVRRLHDQMEEVHRGSLAFRWLQLEGPVVPRRSRVTVKPRPSQQPSQPVVTMPIQIVASSMGIDMQPQG